MAFMKAKTYLPPAVCAWIKSRMTDRGQTINALALAAGVHQGNLNQALAGKRGISDGMLRAIAPHLGLEPGDLVARAAVARLGTEGAAYVVAESQAGVGPVVFVSTGKPQHAPGQGGRSGSNHGRGMVSGDSETTTRASQQAAEGIPDSEGGRVASKWVPLYGPATAGGPIMFTNDDEYAREVISVSVADNIDAGFVIRGNSVSHYNVCDGDIVEVRRLNGSPLVSGDMVVVEHEGAYICKIYRNNALGVYLESHEAGKAAVPYPMTGEVRLVATVINFKKRFVRQE